MQCLVSRTQFSTLGHYIFISSVCACGKWVCTENICNDLEEDDWEDDVAEDDWEDDAPEDDPDVQGIRWF